MVELLYLVLSIRFIHIYISYFVFESLQTQAWTLPDNRLKKGILFVVTSVERLVRLKTTTTRLQVTVYAKINKRI